MTIGDILLVALLIPHRCLIGDKLQAPDLWNPVREQPEAPAGNPCHAFFWCQLLLGVEQLRHSKKGAKQPDLMRTDRTDQGKNQQSLPAYQDTERNVIVSGLLDNQTDSILL